MCPTTKSDILHSYKKYHEIWDMMYVIEQPQVYYQI